MLTVQGITKQFRGRAHPAVDDVSFAVREGEAVGIVGESGSGKSTTARCVANLLRPDSGSILFEGRETVGASPRQLRGLRTQMQMVFQDPFASLSPRMTVEQLVGEGLIVHKLAPDRRARRDRVVEVLEQVGLSAEHLSRYPRSFSGGQRQRIAIARAIAVRPRLLICDEPVSSLDVSVQAQVLNLLKDLREELGLSILFIAHDLAVVRYLCESVVVMSDGRVVESGSRDAVFSSPQHDYTRALLSAVPIPDPQAERARRAAASV